MVGFFWKTKTFVLHYERRKNHTQTVDQFLAKDELSIDRNTTESGFTVSSKIESIIEDYLKMVKEHLPPNSNAEDIIDELRSHILDAAQINTTGEISTDSVWKVLGGFGAPSEVARQYLEHDTFEPQSVSSPNSTVLIIPKLHWFDILVMVIVTFFVPFQLAYRGSSWSNEVFTLRTSLDAIAWNIEFGGSSTYLHPLLYGLFFGFLNVIFLIQFVRYFSDKITIKRLLFFGFCTLILPMTQFLSSLNLYSSLGYTIYAGPIPTQIVTAIILLYYRGRIKMGPTNDEQPKTNDSGNPHQS